MPGHSNVQRFGPTILEKLSSVGDQDLIGCSLPRKTPRSHQPGQFPWQKGVKRREREKPRTDPESRQCDEKSSTQKPFPAKSKGGVKSTRALVSAEVQMAVLHGALIRSAWKDLPIQKQAESEPVGSPSPKPRKLGVEKETIRSPERLPKTGNAGRDLVCRHSPHRAEKVCGIETSGQRHHGRPPGDMPQPGSWRPAFCQGGLRQNQTRLFRARLEPGQSWRLSLSLIHQDRNQKT